MDERREERDMILSRALRRNAGSWSVFSSSLAADTMHGRYSVVGDHPRPFHVIDKPPSYEETFAKNYSILLGRPPMYPEVHNLQVQSA